MLAIKDLKCLSLTLPIISGSPAEGFTSYLHVALTFSGFTNCCQEHS